MKREKKFDVKSSDEPKQYLKIPTDVLNDSDSIELDLEMNASKTKMVMSRNSRCVSVDTFLFAPLGRKEKKECLRVKVTSLNLDVLFTKRSYSKLKQLAVD